MHDSALLRTQAHSAYGEVCRAGGGAVEGLLAGGTPAIKGTTPNRAELYGKHEINTKGVTKNS